MEIIERSSGFWIVDSDGAIDGPFIEYQEAQEKLKQIENGSLEPHE